MSAENQVIDDFLKKYQQAPDDRPFDKEKIREVIAEVADKGSMTMEDAKSRLRAALSQNDQNLIRRDASASVGDALTTKEISVNQALL